MKTSSNEDVNEWECSVRTNQFTSQFLSFPTEILFYNLYIEEL